MTTAKDSLLAAESTAMYARTSTCALGVTVPKNILTGEALEVKSGDTITHLLQISKLKKKNFISSHLPTHRITVYPMVTIRISDRHRLIQPYIHNYSWLLFAALALYTSGLSSEKEIEGEVLDSSTLSQASDLQTRCSQLITDCLLKGQSSKGKSCLVFTSGFTRTKWSHSLTLHLC